MRPSQTSAVIIDPRELVWLDGHHIRIDCESQRLLLELFRVGRINVSKFTGIGLYVMVENNAQHKTLKL